jgi:hypothetical protein
MNPLVLVLMCAPVLRQPQGAPAQGAPAAAPEQLSADEVEQRIRSYLGAIDVPITAADWQRLGPQAAAALERIARDPDEFPTHRAKAVDGLAAIGSPTAPDTILALANDEKEPLVIRVSAVHGVGRLLPSADVVARLQPVLERAQDGHGRRAAAEVLSRHGGCAAVQQQAGRETERALLSRALEKCKE